MKFLKFMIIILITIFRIYLISNILYILYEFFDKKSEVIYEISWYICALLFDLYLINLENTVEVNIYNKKSDGQEPN